MRSRILYLLLCIGLWVGSAASIAVTDIAGAGDDEFLRAVEIWLGDDDVRSLTMLASLSRKGNRAARLLLARIEITDRAPSVFVFGLDRIERNELYRDRRESSQFYPSWIWVEAEDGDQYAVTLRRAGELGIDFEAVRQLYALGEKEAAEHKIRKIAVDGSQRERAQLAKFLGPDDEHAPYLHGFRYAQRGMTTGQTALQTMIGQVKGVQPFDVELGVDADTKLAIVFVDIGYQAGRQVADYDLDGRHFDTITQWLLEASSASPIARLCRRTCSEAELPMCVLTAFGLIGGYYELLRFDSPLETLISQLRFLSSDRAEGMVSRKIASARSEASVPVFELGELRNRSACLATSVGG
ncbi:MAG: hypothetical protein GY935_15645, partial [Gammaproteobacteria bacterium]|nr:hypothetical protein [Gammaproteobacteria bacterium]